MKFSQLMRRELHWWWRHPSLWWTFPCLLLFVTVSLQLTWWATTIKVNEMEGLWRAGAMLWQWGGRETLKSNPMAMMAIGDKIPMIDSIMAMSVEEVWAKAVIPFLQVTSMMGMCLVIAPVSVIMFRRDTDSGALRAVALNASSTFGFLLSKLLSAFCILLPLQVCCALVALTMFQQGTGHPEWFAYTDLLWWWTFLGLGLGLGCWTMVMSWAMCLFTRNTATEIYASSIVASLAVMICGFVAFRFGWNQQTIGMMGFVLWGSLPPALGLLSVWMKRKGYLYRS